MGPGPDHSSIQQKPYSDKVLHCWWERQQDQFSEPSFCFGLSFQQGFFRCWWAAGGWLCWWGLEVAWGSNITEHRFIFSLNSSKVTICHFLVFLPWTGGGFSRTTQMRWCRGNVLAGCGVWGAKCPMIGMPAGMTLKLLYVICPAPLFCWWNACVAW